AKPLRGAHGRRDQLKAAFGATAFASWSTALEIHSQIPADEPGRIDRRRIVPRAALQRVARTELIRVLERRRVVGVEQVAEIDAEVHAPSTEPEDLREAHADRRPP